MTEFSPKLLTTSFSAAAASYHTALRGQIDLTQRAGLAETLKPQRKLRGPSPPRINAPNAGRHTTAIFTRSGDIPASTLSHSPRNSGTVERHDILPRYNKSLCFDPFPFPDPPADLRARIAAAECLDAHRKAAIDRDVRVTMTGMYNVVAKLRSGNALTPKERTIHELAACGVLRDIHDELDALVAEAYGWPWPMSDDEILERLVALHDVRVEEEKQGLVRWLRPEFQAPGQTVTAAPAELSLERIDATTVSETAAPVPWPAEAVEQIGALKRLVGVATLSVDDATKHFAGAKREIVSRHLETLAILGEVRELGDGRYGGSGVG